MQQKKDDSTQMLDLGLEDLGGPRLRVSQGANPQPTEVAFDLGNGQGSKGEMPHLTDSSSHDSSQKNYQPQPQGFSASLGPGSAFGDTSHNVPTLGYQNVFTESVQLTETRKTSAIAQMLAAVVVVVFLLLAYEVYNTGDLSRVFEMASNGNQSFGLFGSTEETKPEGKDEASSSMDTQTQETQQLVKGESSKQTSALNQESAAINGNVWKLIRNEMGGQLLPRGVPLTVDQEASLKAGIAHEYTYQRYRTVLELAELRAPASEELLRQALESRKFWIRMRALIALADLGDQITDDDVKQALGDAHSELRSRFFKRFERGACSVGCFYVARAALKHLDAPGRQQALRVITREASDVRDVFLVAATFDSHPNVRQTAEEWLSTQNVDKSVWEDIRSKLGQDDSQTQMIPKRQVMAKKQHAGAKLTAEFIKLDCLQGAIEENAEKALKILGDTIAKDPDSFAVSYCYLGRAKNLKKLGKTDDADKDINHVEALAKKRLSEHPEDIFVYRVLGDVAHYRKNYKEAIAQKEKALAMSPDKDTGLNLEIEFLKLEAESNAIGGTMRAH